MARMHWLVRLIRRALSPIRKDQDEGAVAEIRHAPDATAATKSTPSGAASESVVMSEAKSSPDPATDLSCTAVVSREIRAPSEEIVPTQPDLTLCSAQSVPSAPAQTEVTVFEEREEPLQRTAGMILHELYEAAKWGGEHEAKIPRLLEEIRLVCPQKESVALDRVERGKAERRALEPLYNVASRFGAGSAEVKRARDDVLKRFPHLRIDVKKRIDRGAAAFERRCLERQRRNKGGPLSRVRPGKEDHGMWKLRPSDGWVLYIDETGGSFELGARDRQGQGRFVGVLLPQEVRLAPLPPLFHAVDERDHDKLDEYLQRLLDSRVGVIGISLTDLRPMEGHLWATGVMEVVQWVLRLLPVDRGTRLRVVVEQRDAYIKPENWEPARSEALRHLAESDPRRASLIKLAIDPARKGQHMELGYADLVAFTWGSPAASSKERLHKSGLDGCLLTGKADELRALWDRAGRVGELDGQQWRGLLDMPDVARPGSIAAMLTLRLQETCRARPDLWRRYLDATQEHLESKGVNLASLGRQTDWLERSRPADTPLPPRLRMMFLTTQLARCNHLGWVESEWQRELEEASRTLYEEDPRAVCLTDLYLAVAATNRFDFGGAELILRPWRDRPPAVPGRQMRGRLLSSWGQLEAFHERHAEATRYFDEAIVEFDRLSERDVALGEITQTRVYRAIAIMDAPAWSQEEARAAVEAAVGTGLTQATSGMAEDASDLGKYLHHLVVRYLVQRGSEAEVHVYLDRHNEWSCGEGHPWPLIQAYRAFLMHRKDPDEACDLMENAREMALDESQGPTVRLIGGVCATIASGWGRPWGQAEEELRRLEEDLPLAKDRVAILRRSLATPSTPLELMTAVLPFNFR